MVVQGIDWKGGVSDAWSSVADFFPKLAVFVIVLLIGWLIARAVSGLIAKVLNSGKVRGVLQRAGLDRFPDVDVVGILAKLVYYFVLLIALQLALSAFGQSNPVSQIVNDIVGWLPQAVVAVVMVVVVLAIANAVSDLLGSALAGQSYGSLLTKLVSAFIIALGVIAALNQVGIGLTVTMPVLVAVLATVGGILVVGVGGALIGVLKPHLDRWFNSLTQPGHHSAGGTSIEI